MTFMDIPLLVQEASGQSGESSSFAEKGHLRSGWIHSFSCHHPWTSPGPSAPCRWAVCVRSVVSEIPTGRLGCHLHSLFLFLFSCLFMFETEPA